MYTIFKLMATVVFYAFVSVIFLSSSSCDFYDGYNNGERPFTARITRFICNGANDTNYMTINKCSLKLLRNGSSLISFNMTVLKPLEPIWITMKLWYKTSGHVYKPMFGIDERVEVCEVLANGAGGKPINKLMYNLFKQYLPHFMKPCPILGEYSVSDFQLNEKMYPPIVPAGDYRNDMQILLSNNDTLISVQFHGSIRARGLADLSLG